MWTPPRRRSTAGSWAGSPTPRSTRWIATCWAGAARARPSSQTPPSPRAARRRRRAAAARTATCCSSRASRRAACRRSGCGGGRGLPSSARTAWTSPSGSKGPSGSPARTRACRRASRPRLRCCACAPSAPSWSTSAWAAAARPPASPRAPPARRSSRHCGSTRVWLWVAAARRGEICLVRKAQARPPASRTRQCCARRPLRPTRG